MTLNPATALVLGWVLDLHVKDPRPATTLSRGAAFPQVRPPVLSVNHHSGTSACSLTQTERRFGKGRRLLRLPAIGLPFWACPP